MVDSMIRLFPSTATVFTTNGLGYLTDATKCTVGEERNGSFELSMSYPITGRHYSDILLRSIIVAKPNPYDDPQPFRIYEISRPINGIVSISAEHISYDMNGIPVSGGWEASNPTTALNGLKSHSAVTCPFTFWTDKSTEGTFHVDLPSNLRACLGGSEGSILDIFGGEYEFDNFLVRLYGSRGMNRGVTIRYGKNMTDLQQEENCANVYTGVYPYWYSDSEEDGGLVECNPKVVPVEGTFNYTRVMTLDLSSEFQDKPTADQLKARTESYIKNNDIGIPKVSIDVSFANLMDSEEYETAALLETVRLCDTVNVEFEALGVKATAKCISYTYDCLTNKYESIELGEARSNLASTIVDTRQADYASEFKKMLQDAIGNSDTNLMKTIAYATMVITGNLGGNVILHSSTGGESPDEILIMDTTDIKTAKRVWRWNLSGLGYSRNGYNGPYSLAMTMDGVFVADFIQAGTMSCNRLKGGTLTLGGSGNGSGILQMLNSSGTQIGKWDNTGLEAINVKLTGELSMTMKIGSETFTATLGKLPGYSSYSNTYGLILKSEGSSSAGSISLRPPQYNTRGGTTTIPGLMVTDNILCIGGENTSNGDYARVDAGIYTITSSLGTTSTPTIATNISGIHTNVTEKEITELGGGQLIGYGITIYHSSSEKDIIFDYNWIKQTTEGWNIVGVRKGNGLKMYYGTSSSKRYKEILRDMDEDDIKELYKIQPVIAKFKDDILDENDERYQKYHPMFIAEDVDKYFSDAVDHLDDRAENWNVRVMIPAMFQMIKSQKKEIDELKTTLGDMEERLRRLEGQ